MMDISALAAVTNQRFRADTPPLKIDTPPRQPFPTPGTVVFTQLGPHGTFTQEHAPNAGGRDSSKSRVSEVGVAEGIMSRARREAERYPTSVRAQTGLGLSLLNAKRFDEAAEAFNAALSLAPDHFLAKANLALALLARGRVDDAEGLYVQLREAYPQDPVPQIGLAYVTGLRGNGQAAIDQWKEVLQLIPESNAEPLALAHAELATLYLQLNRRREAVAHLRAATRGDVRSAALHHALGVAYVLASQWGKAARSFKAALSLDPGMADSLYSLANMLLRMRRVGEAIRWLDEHLSAQPDDYIAHSLLAQAHETVGDYAHARSEVLLALEWLPESGRDSQRERARLLNNLGVSFGHLGDQPQARANFARAIEASANSYLDPYTNLARSLLTAGLYTEALQVVDASAQYFPEDPRVPTMRAAALYELDRGGEALTEVTRAVDSGEAPIEAHSLLGALLADEERNPGAAVRVLEYARAYLPDAEHDDGLRNNLAYAHLLLGNVAAARSVLEVVPEAEASKHRQAILMATWGLLALWEGHVRKGRQTYERAARVAAEQGNSRLASAIRQKMHLELAKAYLRNGEDEAAAGEIREGLSIGGRKTSRRDLLSLRGERDQ